MSPEIDFYKRLKELEDSGMPYSICTNLTALDLANHPVTRRLHGEGAVVCYESVVPLAKPGDQRVGAVFRGGENSGYKWGHAFSGDVLRGEYVASLVNWMKNDVRIEELLPDNGRNRQTWAKIERVMQSSYDSPRQKELGKLLGEPGCVRERKVQPIYFNIHLLRKMGEESNLFVLPDPNQYKLIAKAIVENALTMEDRYPEMFDVR